MTNFLAHESFYFIFGCFMFDTDAAHYIYVHLEDDVEDTVVNTFTGLQFLVLITLF